MWGPQQCGDALQVCMRPDLAGPTRQTAQGFTVEGTWQVSCHAVVPQAVCLLPGSTELSAAACNAFLNRRRTMLQLAALS